MSGKIAVVILAAGKGTRLKMDLPKPLAPLHKRVLIDYVTDSLKDLGDLYYITGHQNEFVEDHINKNFKNKINYSFIHQKEQLGTGHAVRTYFENNKKSSEYEYTIVTCADTPLLTKDIFEKLLTEIKSGKDAVCATFMTKDPFGYGRIKRFEKGFEIVEQKDASVEDAKILEVNSGLYIFKTNYLEDHIFKILSNNKAGEFYLTDTFKREANVEPLMFEDSLSFLGVNDLYQLSQAERGVIMQATKHLLSHVGVRVIDPSHTYIYSKSIGRQTVVYPNVTIDEDSKIGEMVIIEQGCIIQNSIIDDGAHIKANSYITDSHVKAGAKIGPMAHLRPGSIIGEKSKLGNFVEIKKSTIGKNTSISHLSYVGDAEIGNDVNLGCGFITCNYDGANKLKTVIGDGSFIGSDTQMIAPITIGKDCYVASGSTINKSMNDGDFAVGRARQETKAGLAKKFIKKKEK